MGSVTARRSALAAARKAAGHTQESLAEALRVDRSTVIRWEAGDYAPLPYIRPKLARLLGRSQEQLRDLIEPSKSDAIGPVVPFGADIDVACAWLDRRAAWRPGTARLKVASRLAMLSTHEIMDHSIWRSKVNRSDVVRALLTYYRGRLPGCGIYRATCNERTFETGVLTRPEWLDVACRLDSDKDRISLGSSALDEAAPEPLDASRAVERLAEAAALTVPMTNLPIYRLLDVDVRDGTVGGTLGLASFVQYALTIDLLEGELLDAVVTGEPFESLPLRDRYLPDLASVLNVSERLCAGGVVALCAIARPAEAGRRSPDYGLLVQERAGRVLNAAGRLAVIPKGFHEPLSDYQADAAVGATLRREMEEELFGRRDVDGTMDVPRAAAPMHRSRLSDPMRWLTDRADRLRLECTGFGLNLVSGNYEFASLIVIDDEEFWTRYGGHIVANWEARGIRLYSTLEAEIVAQLVADGTWSNEGLFALLQGLRRLQEVGGARASLPTVKWSLG